jgi:DNA-binding CsgD family transcriptional regulator
MAPSAGNEAEPHDPMRSSAVTIAKPPERVAAMIGPSRIDAEPSSRGDRLEHIIGLIYEAAIEPPRWHDVACALADALEGNVVAVWIRLPGVSSQPETYRSVPAPASGEVFREIWEDGLPWGNVIPATERGRLTTQCFARADAELPEADVSSTAYYERWMAPQGLAPVSPLVHVFAEAGRVPVAAVAIFQRADRPLLDERHLAFANHLVPHLRRAHAILDSMRSMRREQDVFREVIDRIPSGIVLVDDEGRVVAMNTAARLSAESGEGLRIEDDRPVVDDPDENRWLQEVLDKARDPAARREVDPENSVTGRRSAHAGQTPVLVTPLLAPASDSSLPDTAALIFLGSPALSDVTSVRLLRSLYELTRAEAELALLLADGLSLEEAAERRHVTLNTARSQLKRVFAKTGARRQSDLVRIVLGGLVSTRTGERTDSHV